MKKAVITAITAAAAITALIIIYTALSPVLLAVADTTVRSLGQEILGDAIAKTLEECDYDSVTRVYYDEGGDVSLVEINGAEVNSICSKASSYALAMLRNINKESVSVSLGSAFSVLTAGKGPKVNIYVTPVGTVETSYYSRFEAAGVNQTRHKLYIRLKAEILASLGSASESYTVEDSILLCENIIIGKIPGSYVDVNNEEDMLNLIPEM